ncbi:MAG: YHYH protein [Bacteroidetes bacterium]|nr:YHYH protein [Bacteroidota bacterium]
MKKLLYLTFILVLGSSEILAQSNPAITNWIINTSGIKGRYYTKGNSTPQTMNDDANVQKVQYSTNWVYISATGVPAYPTGPFLDKNPSVTTNQNAIFRFPLNPEKNTGTPTKTKPGNIGNFINGVALFDYRDGASWDNANQKLAGGPLMGSGDGVWNRDAVIAERIGFDCSKGHPAQGNYHHHQNPSAFNLDKVVVSNVCDLYAADGLYIIDETKHSPLIGYAYDGYPIYGAYGYKNADGSGGVVRIKSGYQLRNITQRTTYYDGTDVTDGPDVNSTYPIGTFREDYEFIVHSGQEDYLDIHNGRFCVTPEYPNGTYAYFCTVDENWNSAYPYAVGPTYYGVVSGGKVNSINEQVSEYKPSNTSVVNALLENEVVLYPNPAGDLTAIQVPMVQQGNYHIEVFDINGKMVHESWLWQGSTIAYIDTKTLYAGTYLVRIALGDAVINKKLSIQH